MTTEDDLSLPLLARQILTIRDQAVILDSDLAKVFAIQTKRLNEAVKRNARRFGSKYAFQLSDAEFAALRSQSATSKAGRGGRRYPPWVFSEHGVVMVATILDSEQAIEASKLIVDVFVEVKRALEGKSTALVLQKTGGELASAPEAQAISRLDTGFWSGMGEKLQLALDRVLDSVIDPKNQTTVLQEAHSLISESLSNLKERLKKTGLENEELAAKATKLLAEAEKEKAMATKTQAEAEAIQFTTTVKKLRLLIEARKAMAEDKVDGFLETLKELGK